MIPYGTNCGLTAAIQTVEEENEYMGHGVHETGYNHYCCRWYFCILYHFRRFSFFFSFETRRQKKGPRIRKGLTIVSCHNLQHHKF